MDPAGHGTRAGPRTHGAEAPGGRAARARERSAEANAVALRELDALVALLADPSPAVWSAVRRALERAGRAAGPALRRAEQSPEPRVRARARTLRLALERRAPLRRLFATGVGRGVELEAGLWRLTRAIDPSFDASTARAELDRLAARVRARARGVDDGLMAALALVDVLAEEEGFRGDDHDYHHPDNVHFGRVIERRRGLPLSLVAVYLAVARRAGIRASAVALPGHVVLRLRAGERSLLVDPFHGGKIRTRKDCLTHLLQHGFAPRVDWFADAPDGVLLGRQVRNLVNALGTVGRHDEARALSGLLAHATRRAPAPAE